MLLHINEMENRINARLDKGTERMDCIEQKIVNTASAMTEVLEILTMGKSLFRLAGYLGDFLKWVVGVGAAIGAIWASFKYDWFR